MRKVKCVLVGSAHTGKTSIVNRYVFGDFTLHTVCTTQPAFSQKKFTHREHDLSLEIWDTAGQERYRALSPLFYRDAEAGIVVFDLTDADSFSKAEKWITELKQARGDQIHIVIVGNKSDLTEERVVNKEDAVKLATSINVKYFETSAKSNTNIDDLFISIADHIVDQMIASLPPAEQPGSKSLKGSIKFSEGQPRNSPNPCC